MAAGSMFFFIFLCGYCLSVQGTFVPPTDSVPAIIEDVRRADLQRDPSSASRIVAGWPAQDGQIPHQVSVRMINQLGAVSSCGGSVIHHEWVITAAHCVSNRYTFVIRIGLTNITRPEHTVETNKRYIYPGYFEPAAGVQTDDIALVKLDQWIEYGPFIQPCRLQSSAQKNDVYSGVVLTASGYGLTEDTVNGGAASEILNWVYLRGISNELCRSWYPTSTIVQDETICAEYYNNTAQSSCSVANLGGAVSEVLNWVYLRGISNELCRSWYSTSTTVQAQTICAEYYNNTAQSSCSGDSGGPLTFADFDGRPTMVGVASFVSSSGCNSPFPSGWVRPGHYHEWYRQVTGLNFDWSQPSIRSDTDTLTGIQTETDPEPLPLGTSFGGFMMPN